MANDSSTGGYLLPTGTAPLDDQALDRFFHDVFMSITGLAATLVRPRWEMEPGNMPPWGTNWIAQGVVELKEDGVAWQWFNPVTQAFMLCRNETLVNRVSFYGPGAGATQSLLRDGLSLDQNRTAMNAQGINLVRTGDPRNASMQINAQWQKRLDVDITFRRLISRNYPVLSLLSGEVELRTDTGLVEIININP